MLEIILVVLGLAAVFALLGFIGYLVSNSSQPPRLAIAAPDGRVYNVVLHYTPDCSDDGLTYPPAETYEGDAITFSVPSDARLLSILVVYDSEEANDDQPFATSFGKSRWPAEVSFPKRETRNIVSLGLLFTNQDDRYDWGINRHFQVAEA